MSNAHKQLLETLSGHISLLRVNYPKKAASQTARKARQYVQAKLRESGRVRLAA